MVKAKQESKKYLVFNTDKNLKDAYNYVRDFLNIDWKYIFILAAGYGFAEGIRTKTKTKTYLGRTETFSEEDWAIIYSIALYEEETIDILDKKGNAGEIVEEYANTGIKLLQKEISDQEEIETFSLKLEKNIRQQIQK